MKINGVLLEVFETKQITATFKKREIVVEYVENSQYPEYIKFEIIQDKCDIIDQFSIGQELEIHFNLKGRKWTDPQGKIVYFNSLQAWKVLDANNQPSESTHEPGVSGENEPPAWLENEENSDPPF